MKDVHFLKADDLAAVGHPLRQRILGLLARSSALSGREIAERIPGAPSNPYYHLDVLREAGLVEVVRTARRRGATEKYYAAVARSFSLDPGELAGTDGVARARAGILAVARNGAEDALEQLSSSLERPTPENDPEDPFVNLCALQLPVSRARELRERMREWLEDALEADRKGRAEGDREETTDDQEERCQEYVFYQLFFRAGAA